MGLEFGAQPRGVREAGSKAGALVSWFGMGRRLCRRQGPLAPPKDCGCKPVQGAGSFSSQWDQPFSSQSGLLPSLFSASTMGVFSTH